MKRRLGHLETQVLAYAQMRQVRTVRTDEAGGRLGISVPACKTVYRLVKGLELAAFARNNPHTREGAK